MPRRRRASGGSGVNEVRILRDLARRDASHVSETLQKDFCDNDADFMLKFRKLKNVAKQQKKVARKNAHQYSWLRNYTRLADEATRTEGELKAVLAQCASSGGSRSTSSRIGRWNHNKKNSEELQQDLDEMLEEMETNDFKIVTFRRQLALNLERTSAAAKAVAGGRQQQPGSAKSYGRQRGGRGREKARRAALAAKANLGSGCAADEEENKAKAEQLILNTRTLLDDLGESLVDQLRELTIDLQVDETNKLVNNRGDRPNAHNDSASSHLRAARERVQAIAKAENIRNINSKHNQQQADDEVSLSALDTEPLTYLGCIDKFREAFRFENLPDSVYRPNEDQEQDQGQAKSRFGKLGLSDTELDILLDFRSKLDKLDQATAENLCQTTVDYENKIRRAQKSIQSLQSPSTNANTCIQSRYYTGTKEPHHMLVLPWGLEDDRRLRTIYETYCKAPKLGGAGRGETCPDLDLYTDRLRIEFPRRSTKELKIRLDIQKMKKLFRSRNKAVLTHWEHAKREMLQEATQRLRVAARSESFRLELAEERDRDEATRNKKREHHNVLMEKYMRKRELELEEQRKKDEEQRALEALRKKQLEKDHYEMDLRLQKFWKKKADAEQRRMEETKRAQEVEEKRRRERLVSNKERVDYRAELRQERQQKILDAQLQKQREKEEQAIRLEALRMQVTREFNHISANRDRVQRHTKAFVNAMKTKTKGGGMFKVNGYDMDTLMKDQRFKITMALQAAGLHTSDYARHVIAKAPTATKPRSCMKSRVEL